jgi:chromosome segregation protein
VHLETLTLRGFKSFASSTTLRFEPGITCIVGPNGSGKSNIVDALAWVMGEQGAKSLRGARMDDVIFAGTAGRAARPALGRAEVLVTIDNGDGALPVDYAEVTISRIMFAGGGSEYAINGSTCRLLDVQELLSDSGIGREMHVVVGQGRLESVLSGSPEDRRGFIEEAAGVLKHRKRKEKALRKLDAMSANLSRLQDLTAELRRQLGPLGRQAEVARRAATVQAEARDARLRLTADDLVALRTALAADAADEEALRRRRDDAERALATASAHEQSLEQRARELTPRLAAAQATWYALSSLRERLRGTAAVAVERRRHVVDVPGSDLRERDAEIVEETRQLRRHEAQLAADLGHDRRSLGAAEVRRAAAEAALAEEDRRLGAVLRAAADRREGVARLVGEVEGLRGRADAADAELRRLEAAAGEARARGEQAKAAFAALESTVAGLDVGELDLDAEYEAARAEQEAADEALGRLREEEREADRHRAALAARTDALEMGLAPRDGAKALLTSGDPLAGVLGQLSGLVSVEPEAATAVAAALGDLADAVAVDGLDGAVAALRLLRDDDSGRAALLVAGHDSVADSADDVWPPLPDGAAYAIDLVRAPDRLQAALRAVLARVAVVPDLRAAQALVTAQPRLRAVTSAGELLGVTFAVGGSSSAPSGLETRAAHEDAVRRQAAAVAEGERVRFALAAAVERCRQAGVRADAALDRLHESDARLAAVAEQLGQLGAAARAAGAEADRLDAAVARGRQAHDRDRAELAALEQRLAVAQAAAEPAAPSAAERDRLAAACADARRREVEARLAVRTGEERARAVAARIESLDRAMAAQHAARERAAAQRERRARQAAVARAVAAAAGYALARVEDSLRRADAERGDVDRARLAVEAELAGRRGAVRELTAELERLTDSLHRDELARSEQRLRVESLEQRVREELGVDPETLVAEFGPHRGVPFPPPEEAYDRGRQEKRLRAAERALAALGKVNPLALEDYTALEERHAFLTEQLRDLQATRRDLLGIVREVDERVEQVFAAAYADTAREFEDVFARLFPGGEGRLVLTDPDDLLSTGIDIEARPAGKKIKRLSLLSGGERALTAVALLVAIFKARPSPFYVLDEVEAALDDTNLGRLLTLLAELRASSQLVIVTHQKRTMEIADALYGVSMRGDGVSEVISQRLREPVSA